MGLTLRKPKVELDTHKTIQIVLVGDPKSGKSSILHRYTSKTFSYEHKPTQKTQGGMKSYVISEFPSPITIQLWEIAGNSNLWQNISVGLILLEATMSTSAMQDSFWKWSEYLTSHKRMITHIVITKSDHAKDISKREKLIREALGLGTSTKIFFTSAFDNTGIDAMMKSIMCDSRLLDR